MTIQLPLTVKNADLDESQLIMIALLHKLSKQYGDTWFNFYIFDIKMILVDKNRIKIPTDVFEGMRQYVKVAYTSERNLDVRLKRWTGDEFDYQIKDFRNVLIWCIILDEGPNYIERNRVPLVQQHRSMYHKENLIRALKTDYLEYERNRLRK